MESTDCALCGSSTVSELMACGDPDHVASSPFRIVRCGRCNLVYVNPRPTPFELRPFYPREYYRKPGEPLAGFVDGIGKLLQRFRSRRIARYRPAPGRVLDVGCGDGSFLASMRDLGWEAWGVEPSEAGASLAGGRGGLRIHREFLQERRFPESHFDAVTLWHSLEHVGSPGSVLREIERVLKPGGLLMVAVPNIASLEFRLFKKSWFHLDLPRHLYHFSPDTLGRMLKDAGVEVIRIRYFSWEYNLFGFLQSVLNCLSTEMNFLYKFLKGVPVKRRFGSPAGILDTFVLILALAPVLLMALIWGIVTGCAHKAGCLEVYARKPAASAHSGKS